MMPSFSSIFRSAVIIRIDVNQLLVCGEIDFSSSNAIVQKLLIYPFCLCGYIYLN